MWFCVWLLYFGRFGTPHVFSWIFQIFVGIWGPLKEKTKNLSQAIPNDYIVSLERRMPTIIRRTDTTTLYHVTEMLKYHVKHQLLLNKMQSFLWRNKLPWQQESLAKTPFILVLVAHIWKWSRWPAQFVIAQKWSAGQGDTLCKVFKTFCEADG